MHAARVGSSRLVLCESQQLSASTPFSLQSPSRRSDHCDSFSPGLSFSLQDSAIPEVSQLPELSQSPGLFSDSEDKENCDGRSLGHHRQQSVIIKSGVEQSYAHILNVLRKRGKQEILSDEKPPATKSSFLESPEVPVIEVDLSPSDKPYRTPIACSQKHNSYTSPYGGTTNHTESNHFEIDLFENPHAAQNSWGALPARAYCPKCLVDVSTSVSLQLPRLPL